MIEEVNNMTVGDKTRELARMNSSDICTICGMVKNPQALVGNAPKYCKCVKKKVNRINWDDEFAT